jgi:hypothetical protein
MEKDNSSRDTVSEYLEGKYGSRENGKLLNILPKHQPLINRR